MRLADPLTWAALGLGNVGGTLKRAIDQFASGGIGGGVVQTLERQLRAATGLDVNRDSIGAWETFQLER